MAREGEVSLRCKDDEPNLCISCRDIDLALYVQDMFPRKPECGVSIVQELGRRISGSSKLNCPLCSLLHVVSGQYVQNYKLQLRCFTDTDQPYLAVVREEYNPDLPTELGSSGFLVSQPAPFKIDLPVKIVQPAHVRYDLVSGWLRHCNQQHIKCWKPELPPSKSLYVIDCDARVVLRLPPNADYVALSYVWGTQSQGGQFSLTRNQAHAIEGQSLEDLPLTIRDAMKVVIRIGFRYLWVDQYCIAQHDIQQRQEAISKMDSIYAIAALTIVALSGHNIGSGLPGVSHVHRTELQQVKTSRVHVVSTFPPLRSVIANSVWNTRGWCYQEVRSSRRCLFFSDHQIYFGCRTMVVSEALPNYNMSSSFIRRLCSYGLQPSIFASRDVSFSFGLTLDRLVYSRKRLTHENDALDAFRGILKFYPCKTLWGVPVTACRTYSIEQLGDPCITFAMGLIWTARPSFNIDRGYEPPKKLMKQRRPGFPTWSWTSIIGEVFQDRPGGSSIYANFLAGKPALLSRLSRTRRFDIYLGSSRHPLNVVCTKAQSNVLPEIYTSLYITGDLVKVQQSDQKYNYHFCRADGTVIDGHVLSADMDISPSYGLVASRALGVRDALVLVEWNDDQPASKTRFVLMLLKWTGDGVAEREGLLSQYEKHWDVQFVESLPRIRASFELR